MHNIDNIASEEAQTDEDILSGDFCECGHGIKSEHYIGEVTNAVKCFGLTFNGTIWSSCRCSKIVPKRYSITVKVQKNAENKVNAA